MVKHKYSLGGEQNLWELYPVIFTGEHHWVLVNDDDDIKTIIPHKSVGCLNNSKVLNLLEKIKNFKKEKNMNLALDCKEFGKYLVFLTGFKKNDSRARYVFRFDNNYGASVVKNKSTLGGEQDLWELAVIKFKEDTDDLHIDCTTSIASDIIGNLSDEEVMDYLKKIKELPTEYIDKAKKQREIIEKTIESLDKMLKNAINEKDMNAAYKYLDAKSVLEYTLEEFDKLDEVEKGND